jgi:hypothetical protein
MKRIFFALLALIVPLALGAQELDYYTQQFDDMDTVRDQFGIVQNVTDLDEDATAFYAHALDRLVKEYPEIKLNTDKKIADDMAKVLCQKLGEAGHADSGANLWYVADNFFDPLVKAAALKALGEAGATDYIPQVSQLLLDLNNAPNEDRMNQEQTAYGAIEGLEAYKAPEGYLPVFFASVGWYSERIKSRANEALPKIMDNPSEPLTSVIKSSEYGYNVKLGALQVLEAADITTQQKAAGAVAALVDAWKQATNIVGERSTLTRTRKLALSMIRRYGTEDANVYPALERSYREGADEEEQIAAIAALSALATDDSARRLSSFLMDMNQRMRSGTLTREDERMVRVIIPALGNTGRQSARPALRSVLNLDWTGAVQRLAQDALKKIQ